MTTQIDHQAIDPYTYGFDSDFQRAALRALLTGLVDRYTLAEVLNVLDTVCYSKAGERRIPFYGREPREGQTWRGMGNAIRNAESVARRHRL